MGIFRIFSSGDVSHPTYGSAAAHLVLHRLHEARGEDVDGEEEGDGDDDALEGDFGLVHGMPQSAFLRSITIVFTNRKQPIREAKKTRSRRSMTPRLIALKCVRKLKEKRIL